MANLIQVVAIFETYLDAPAQTPDAPSPPKAVSPPSSALPRCRPASVAPLSPAREPSKHAGYAAATAADVIEHGLRHFEPHGNRSIVNRWGREQIRRIGCCCEGLAARAPSSLFVPRGQVAGSMRVPPAPFAAPRR